MNFVEDLDLTSLVVGDTFLAETANDLFYPLQLNIVEWHEVYP